VTTLPLAARRGPSTGVRVVVALALALAAFFGFDVLEDALETHADVLEPGTRSALEVDVRVARGPRDAAAAALVAACAWTVPDHTVTFQGPVGDDGRYALDVEPALGTYGRRKLVGCLEDGTLDRVWADVRSITRTDPAR
jgi:hypothetical protein